MGKHRAQVGTREGNAACARCRHARLAHLQHGVGPCSRYNIETTPDGQGRNVSQAVRCTCPSFTTDQELF